MKRTAQKHLSSTQSFTEIRDIRENIVLMHGGNACTIIEVTSVNFALLAPEEQDSKVAAYAALLNSLSFPIQLVVQSKQIDITPYLASLETQIQKTTNQKLAEDMKKYKEFIEQMIKTTVVLDKKFYIIVGYGAIEGSFKTASLASVKDPPIDTFFNEARAALNTKVDSLLPQIDRLGLKTQILEKESLVKLFYSFYNEGENELAQETIHSEPITKGGGK